MSTSIDPNPGAIERVTLPARWINDIGSPRKEKAEAAFMAIGWTFEAASGLWVSDDPSTLQPATAILLEWAPWLKGSLTPSDRCDAAKLRSR